MVRPRDAKEVIERLGRGESAESLGLKHGPDGLVDLRGLKLDKRRPQARFRVGQATFDYLPTKPIFDDLVLRDVDLSGAFLEDSYWRNCSFKHVRLDRVRCRGVNFASSDMDSVSFARADLRFVNWGLDRLDGPVLSRVDLVKCDLRRSTYGHPLFQNCKWVDCNLKGVNFAGSRFEDCTFEGLIDAVWFHGHDHDPDPRIAALRNPMKNVDFSRAELRDVDFSHEIDLTMCKFPEHGYIRMEYPREVHRRAIERIKAAWSGQAREKAIAYLEVMLRDHFREEQPFTLIRPVDFEKSPLGREVGLGIVRELEEAAKDVG